MFTSSSSNIKLNGNTAAAVEFVTKRIKQT